MSYMKTLTKREVGQTPALLWATAEAAAESGETVWVTDRGQPRYRVEYVPTGADPLAALEASGIYTPPSKTPAPRPKVSGHYSHQDVEVILNDIRGNR